MHIAFIDIVTDYAADRPDEDKPLGGTTSAVCFLARELVKAGIPCTLFTKIREPRVAHGIPALPFETLIDERANPEYTAFVFVGRWVDWLVKAIRETSKAPLVAWMHESTFNPELVPVLAEFNGVVFVSEWQQRINQPHCLPHWKQIVLRNAMNPRAAEVFAQGEAVMPSKAVPPILVYAGATPRGAFHIPALLDKLRPKQEAFTVEIYCDCTPTTDAEANAKYIEWMRGLPNVKHVGMVGQADFLQRLKRAAFMISPNPWPETSCIAMMEAMVTGLSVITTNRAALPETAAGFAKIVPIEDPDHPTRFDMPIPFEEFAETISTAINEWIMNPMGAGWKLQKQIAYFRENYQWSQRVEPWVEFLKSFG